MKEKYLKWLFLTNQIDFLTYVLLKKKISKNVRVETTSKQSNKPNTDPRRQLHAMMLDAGIKFDLESRKYSDIHALIKPNEYSDFNIRSRMFSQSDPSLATEQYINLYYELIRPFLNNVHKMFCVTGNAFKEEQRSASINNIDKISHNYAIGTNITFIVDQLNIIMSVIVQFLNKQLGLKYHCPKVKSINFILSNKNGIINFISWE